MPCLLQEQSVGEDAGHRSRENDTADEREAMLAPLPSAAALPKLRCWPLGGSARRFRARLMPDEVGIGGGQSFTHEMSGSRALPRTAGRRRALPGTSPDRGETRRGGIPRHSRHPGKRSLMAA